MDPRPSIPGNITTKTNQPETTTWKVLSRIFVNKSLETSFWWASNNTRSPGQRKRTRSNHTVVTRTDFLGKKGTKAKANKNNRNKSISRKKKRSEWSKKIFNTKKHSVNSVMGTQPISWQQPSFTEKFSSRSLTIWWQYSWKWTCSPHQASILRSFFKPKRNS